MDQKTQITSKIREAVQVIWPELDLSDIKFQIDRPKDESHGDFASNIAMALAKQTGLKPQEIADKVVQVLKENSEFEEISIAGPGFINFKLNPAELNEVLLDVLGLKEQFGHNDSLAGQKILIEHTSPNPNKEMHLGHLKNNVIGLSVSYILEANGAQIFRDCIDNNRGIAIAKLMWGYLKFARRDEATPVDLHYWFDHQDEWHTPDSTSTAPGLFVDKLYTQGSEDFKNPESEEIVRQMLIDWEAEEPHNRALWRLTQDWVWEGYKDALTRVDGWKFDHIWHEDEIYKKGKEHVLRGVEEGIFKKLEDGAVLTDLKDFKLPDTILMRGDGTSLYITQDLELTYLKRQKFNPDQMMWVIGPEQSLAMKQMFAVCSQLGFGKYEDYHHLAYGFILVKDKDGNPSKMSSRNGTQLYTNAVLDQAQSKLKDLVNLPNILEGEKEEIAEAVGVAAVKYALLRVNRTQDMVFDFDTTVSLDGDSGPYLLYTYARIQSLLQKGSFTDVQIDGYNFETEEQSVLRKLSEYPEIVLAAAKEYAPHLVANYLYDLAQKYNKVYNTYAVLDSEESTKQARLSLAAASAQVLQNGLKLLGINTVERM